MAFGDSEHDAALRAAWHDFCARLQEAGDRVFGDYTPATSLQRADGFRFLAQNLGQAFDLALETKNTKYPAIHSFCTPYCKLGGDNADFTYQQAWIDGNSVYKISGRKGTARFFNITVQGTRPEKMPGTNFPSLNEPFGDIPEANIFGHQLKTEWDGSFELYIGGPKREPNWLPTTPGTRKLFIRQGFDSWDETSTQMRIERIDMDAPSPMPTAETMLTAIGWAAQFITGLMEDWPEQPFKYSPLAGNPSNPNIFPQDDPNSDGGKDKLRGRSIAQMHWRLAADEALIIEFEGADRFWMVTNMGSFMNSMDFLYRPVSYTPARSKMDSDGKVRLIMCHDDPGYHNWIDTQGFEVGNMTFRNMLSDKATRLDTKLVKRNALAKALPAESVKVTPEERTAQLWARFNSIRRRYVL
jgi:hypothetical protein